MQIMKHKNFLQAAVAATVLAVYFFNAGTVVEAVKEGLLLCYNTVIPSLFVFMIIASALSCFKGSEILGFPFIPFFRLLKISDRKLISYCVLSMLGGFATGGQFLNKIGKEYNCDKNLNCVLALLAGNNSPAFVIIAVGLQMLGSIKTGVLLYISAIVSCYITAFIMSFILPYNDYPEKKYNADASIDICDSIKYSVSSILNICGIVIFVNCICKVIQLYSVSSALSVAFSVVCEVTAACNMIYEEFGKNLYLICIAVTIFPLSAYFQMKSFDEYCIYNFKVLLAARLFQIPISICILRILVNIFPVASSVYASGDIKVNIYWNAPHISVCLLILSICFVVLFDKKHRYLLKPTNKI